MLPYPVVSIIVKSYPLRDTLYINGCVVIPISLGPLPSIKTSNLLQSLNFPVTFLPIKQDVNVVFPEPVDP